MKIYLWFFFYFNSQVLDRNCDTSQNGGVVPMTVEYKLQLLKLHNSLRNDLALGVVGNFPAAARMGQLVSVLFLHYTPFSLKAESIVDFFSRKMIEMEPGLS